MCRLRFPGGDRSRRTSSAASPTSPSDSAAATPTSPPAPTSRSARSARATRSDVLTGLHELGHRQPRRRRRQHPQRHRARPTAGIDPHELIDTLPLAPADAPLHPQPPRDVRPAAQVQHRLRRRRRDQRARRHQRHRLHAPSASARATSRRCPRGRLLPPARSAASPATRTSPATRACCSSPRSASRSPPRSSASSSSTATAPTARRRGSSTCSTPGASTSSSPRREKRARPAAAPRAARTSASRGAPVDQHGHVGVPSAEAAGPVLRRRRAAGRPDDRASRCAASPTSPTASAAATIRLTVWQNLLISDIPERTTSTTVKARDRSPRPRLAATSVRGGLVACTGNAGCKFAAADTKRHAMAIADYLEQRLAARPADQHPPHRLPPLVRPALHRRHRPDGDEGRGRRATWSRAITSSSAAATARSRRSGGSCSATCVAERRAAMIERMLRAYLRTGSRRMKRSTIRRRQTRRTATSRGPMRRHGDPMTYSTTHRDDDVHARRSPCLPTPPVHARPARWLNGFFAGLLQHRTAAGSGASVPLKRADRTRRQPRTSDEEEFPWHDPALALDERLKLAEGKPLARADGGDGAARLRRCGTSARPTPRRSPTGEEKDLTTLRARRKRDAKKLKELVAEPDARFDRQDGGRQRRRKAQRRAEPRDRPRACDPATTRSRAGLSSAAAQRAGLGEGHAPRRRSTSRQRPDLQGRRRAGRLSRELPRPGRLVARCARRQRRRGRC